MLTRREVMAATGTIASGSALRAEGAAGERPAFAKDFVWGASTASYQIEGAVDADGRGKSIGGVFCHTPGRIKNGGDVVCDHSRPVAVRSSRAVSISTAAWSTR